MTDLRSSIHLVYKEEFRVDLIEGCEYLHWEEKALVREPFNLTKCSKTEKIRVIYSYINLNQTDYFLKAGASVFRSYETLMQELLMVVGGIHDTCMH